MYELRMNEEIKRIFYLNKLEVATDQNGKELIKQS